MKWREDSSQRMMVFSPNSVTRVEPSTYGRGPDSKNVALNGHSGRATMCAAGSWEFSHFSLWYPAVIDEWGLL